MVDNEILVSHLVWQKRQFSRLSKPVGRFWTAQWDRWSRASVSLESGCLFLNFRKSAHGPVTLLSSRVRNKIAPVMSRLHRNQEYLLEILRFSEPIDDWWILGLGTQNFMESCSLLMSLDTAEKVAGSRERLWEASPWNRAVEHGTASGPLVCLTCSSRLEGRRLPGWPWLSFHYILCWSCPSFCDSEFDPDGPICKFIKGQSEIEGPQDILPLDANGSC